jgi:hypothetical protein
MHYTSLHSSINKILLSQIITSHYSFYDIKFNSYLQQTIILNTVKTNIFKTIPIFKNWLLFELKIYFKSNK